MLHGIVNKPPIQEAYTVIFAMQSSFHSLHKCEDKCYHQLDAKSIFKTWSFPMWNNYWCLLRHSLTCFDLHHQVVDSVVNIRHSVFMWRVVTWIHVCASLNHRKMMKAEPSRLICRKLTANPELLIVQYIRTYSYLVPLWFAISVLSAMECAEEFKQEIKAMESAIKHHGGNKTALQVTQLT